MVGPSVHWEERAVRRGKKNSTSCPSLLTCKSPHLIALFCNLVATTRKNHPSSIEVPHHLARLLPRRPLFFKPFFSSSPSIPPFLLLSPHNDLENRRLKGKPGCPPAAVVRRGAEPRLCLCRVRLGHFRVYRGVRRHRCVQGWPGPDHKARHCRQGRHSLPAGPRPDGRS